MQIIKKERRYSNLKVTIKAARVNAGMKQREVAEKMGINVATLINWESDKTFPKSPQLLKLCSIYHCAMDDIFVPDMLTKN